MQCFRPNEQHVSVRQQFVEILLDVKVSLENSSVWLSKLIRDLTILKSRRDIYKGDQFKLLRGAPQISILQSQFSAPACAGVKHG